MLRKMRKSAGSPIVKILLFGSLILAFGLWGVADYVQVGPGDDPAASVADIEITPAELYQNYQAELQRMGLVQIEPEQARALGLIDQVLAAMVNRTLFDVEADALGLTTDDASLADEIRANPAFRNELGQFDRLRFEQILALNGLSEGEFTAQLRQDTTRAQFVGSLTGGVRPPQKLVEQVFAFQGERRVAETVQVPLDSGSNIGTPTEAELSAYYDEHQSQFEAPEMRTVTFISLTPEDLVDDVGVEQARLEEEYAVRKAEFTVPERRRVQRILVQDEAAAKAAIERLKAGADFAAIAQEVSGEDAGAIDLGTVTRDEIIDTAIADAAFELEVGDISAPVQGPFGWYIVTVSELEPGSTKPFDEVRDDLRLDLARDEAVEMVYRLANDVEDVMAGGVGLENAARELNLSVVTVGPLSATGEDGSGQRVDTLPGGRFLEVAFEQMPLEDGFLTETPEGGYFILRVDSVTDARLKTIDEVRDEVIDGWTQERRQQKTRERATELVERVKSGESLETIATELNAKVAITDPLTRRSSLFGGPLPPDLLTALFRMRPGEAGMGDNVEGVVIARLLEIQTAGDDPADAELRDRIAEQLRSGIANDIVVQLNEGLRGVHDVTVNAQVIDQLYTGGATAAR